MCDEPIIFFTGLDRVDVELMFSLMGVFGPKGESQMGQLLRIFVRMKGRKLLNSLPKRIAGGNKRYGVCPGR